jgi:hypothetical protein
VADGRNVVGELGEAGSALDGTWIEPCAVVLDAEAHAPVVLAEADRGGGSGAGVLGRILKTLEAAEVDGRLDRLRVAARATRPGY